MTAPRPTMEERAWEWVARMPALAFQHRPADAAKSLAALLSKVDAEATERAASLVTTLGIGNAQDAERIAIALRALAPKEGK